MIQEQLFRCSVQRGLANMSWGEICGSVISCCPNSVGASSTGTRSALKNRGSKLIGLYNLNQSIQYAPTTGNLVVLNFSENIQLNEEYYAAGSLCTPNFTKTPGKRKTTRTKLGLGTPTSFWSYR